MSAGCQRDSRCVHYEICTWYVGDGLDCDCEHFARGDDLPVVHCCDCAHFVPEVPGGTEPRCSHAFAYIRPDPYGFCSNGRPVDGPDVEGIVARALKRGETLHGALVLGRHPCGAAVLDRLPDGWSPLGQICRWGMLRCEWAWNGESRFSRPDSFMSALVLDCQRAANGSAGTDAPHPASPQAGGREAGGVAHAPAHKN